MLVVLHPDTDETTEDFKQTLSHLKHLPNVRLRTHHVQGREQRLTEIYLIGNTAAVSLEEVEALPSVEKVIRISHEFRVLGRHTEDAPSLDFEYNGVRFNQSEFHLFAGLCALDTPRNVERMMQVCKRTGRSAHAWGRTSRAPILIPFTIRTIPLRRHVSCRANARNLLYFQRVHW